ncbi:MAG: CTP synthase, partial [Verrucomicrobiae bacterium]|nr:CTP synthase [Verrucomicrobiae bacterium]
EIKERIYAAGEGVDVLITEIGGTIGDIEGLPFIEGLRQFSTEQKRGDVLFIHVTLVPYLAAAGELKTKPSQQSVAKLREIGIQPDILICRTEEELGDEVRAKLAMFCNVPVKAVIEEQDVETSIYELPIMLQKENVDDLVVEYLNLDAPERPMDDWEDVVRRLKFPDKEVTIGVVGKYIELQDAYKSVYESLTHGGIANNTKVKVARIDAEDLETEEGRKILENLDGILVPGGFGDRGTEGKIYAARFARENKLPYFGLCLGMQIAVIEFARDVMELEGANSPEFDPGTPHPVVHLMEEQKSVTQKGATMRLGSYKCDLTEGTISRASYGTTEVHERHRHRYEFNNNYREAMEEKGLKVAGVNRELNLVEIVEIEDHPWFVGVQFHPEFKSKPFKAHPLFAAFIEAAVKKKAELNAVRL